MSDSKQVRVRIAPSPTGKMHVGTARTALFNYLFAKHCGGDYLVRIEDTDKERSTTENIDFIKNALTWLDLEPDEDYVLQSSLIDQHKAAAQRLLDENKAYLDEGAVRFRIPEGETSWHDLVQGEISYNNQQLEDFVILRSDGTPTYHLGVVVDDAAMEITHIIRGDDHINNTPKQILLHQALGHNVPQFAHVSLIHGPDGKKLSKRHGATSVQDLREKGYLPEALCNYFLRLGWAKGDTEIISREDAIKLFEIEDLNKGAAIFDVDKLNWFNAHYIKEMSNTKLIELLEPFFADLEMTISKTGKQRLIAGLDELKIRAQTLEELAENSKFYFMDPPFELPEKEQTILEEGKEVLSKLAGELEKTEWTPETLESSLKNFVEKSDIPFKALGMPLRLALMGKLGGPSLAGVMVALGKEETLKRLTLSR